MGEGCTSGNRESLEQAAEVSELRDRITSLEHQLEQERQANIKQLSLLDAALKRIPPQPEAALSKPPRFHALYSFLRNIRRKDVTYSSSWRQLVKVVLPTYVVGIFLVWAVASMGAYSAVVPPTKARALYLPPGVSVFVAWAFGFYAGSRDGSRDGGRDGSRDGGRLSFQAFHCVALITALGTVFWDALVSIVALHSPLDTLWMLTLRKILVRLHVFLSTYIMFILGVWSALALANLAEYSLRANYSPQNEAASSQRFQARLAFAGTIITAILSLLGNLVSYLVS